MTWCLGLILKRQRVSRLTHALLLCAVGLTVLAGCERGRENASAGPHKRITLAVGQWPASASLFVANEKGHFADEGLDATIQPHSSGHLGLDAVIAGSADLCTAGETPIARAALAGKPIAVVATIAKIDRSILIIARKDRGIAKAEDLKGKRIGVVPGTTADFFLHIFLTTSHVRLQDVVTVTLVPEKVVDALVDGTVDAISTWAPFTIEAQRRLGNNGVVLDEPGLYTMSWNLVASKELTTRDPDVIVRVLQAIERANRFMREKPGEARTIVAKSTGMALSELEEEWANYNTTTTLSQSLLLYLEDQARWMVSKGAAGKTPNFLDFVHADGLRVVRPSAVQIRGPRE